MRIRTTYRREQGCAARGTLRWRWAQALALAVAVLLLPCAIAVAQEQGEDEAKAKQEALALEALKKKLQQIDTDASDPFDAVTKLESVVNMYKSARVVVDEDYQREVIDSLQLSRLAEYGNTVRDILEGLRRERARFCQECKGKRTLRCEVCKGLGAEPCMSCNGTGTRECDDYSCTGGFETCDKCYGDGTVTEEYRDRSNNYATREIRCDRCKGKGQTPCDKCKGKDKIECDNCHGKKVDLSNSCDECNGRKVVECPTCKGTGRAEEEPDQPPADRPPTAGGGKTPRVTPNPPQHGAARPETIADVQVAFAIINKNVEQWRKLQQNRDVFTEEEFAQKAEKLFYGHLSPERQEEMIPEYEKLTRARDAEVLSESEYLDKIGALFD